MAQQHSAQHRLRKVVPSRSIAGAFAVAAACAIASAQSAGASTFLHSSLRELVRDADSIVTGRVISVESFWNADGTVIVSEATVFVDEQMAGSGPTVEKVRTFGGTVNGYTVDAHGFPVFAAGDRLLLFLTRQDDGSSRVLGYQEGHYRLAFDRGGVERAYPTVDAGARWFAADGREAAPSSPRTLDAFRAQVRAIANDVRAPQAR
jgi:hypothetical protein